MNISGRQKRFFYSNFKPLHQSKCCGALIDNRSDAPICVLEDKEGEKNLNLIHARKMFLVDSALWNISTKELHVNKKCYQLYIYLLTYK